ncbi:uncharacterized protein LOC103176683 isoform X2 [Callorhinchus milii]|uniref:uncharacterized protein LOC103176683 isoform X2 n=1 Tax=Callorhinchus milii TaxID=7868 RepID=UPI00045741A9|nr:uncharacterized protein LOC103176683 isoform X2 [Callorhinchus milii]|eukprot:gi/632946437/ref/XP_007888557.1/ PREDICTED: uncharacterized protein LOC103176683 isoform X2 [Callorhinchus milii]
MPEKTKRGRKPYLTPSEAKRRRLERYRERRKRYINLGAEVEKWRQLKEELNIPSDENLAKILMDYYRCDGVSLLDTASKARQTTVDKGNDDSTSTCTSINESGQPLRSTTLNKLPEKKIPQIDSPAGLSIEHYDTETDSTEDSVESAEEFVEMTSCLGPNKKAFKQCEWRNCNSELDLELKVVATAMKIITRCRSGHKSVWWSQPLLKEIPAGNFQLASSIVLSGNNYRKIALMLKFMNMVPIGHHSFLQIQRLYVLPSVSDYWKKMQMDIYKEITDPIVVLAEGFNNNSAFPEKYFTYTMMDNFTQKVLEVQVINVKAKKMNNSRNIESLWFQNALESLTRNNICVSEAVTEPNAEILSLMKLKFPHILHQMDIWHGIEAINKKLEKLITNKVNQNLQPWIVDILNHFKYCCEHSNDDANILMSRWRSFLHHVVNVHEWQLGDGVTGTSCEHKSLTTEGSAAKKWIKAGSAAHTALREVIYDKWLVSHLNYFIRARVANELESFNDHIQMYIGKNFKYEYDGYKIRNLLAVIDYNSHVNREYQRNADGEIIYCRMYSKRTKHYRAIPTKVQKHYRYIQQLMKDLFTRPLRDTTSKPEATTVTSKQYHKNVKSKPSPASITTNIYQLCKLSNRQIM